MLLLLKHSCYLLVLLHPAKEILIYFNYEIWQNIDVLIKQLIVRHATGAEAVSNKLTSKE